MSFSDYLIIFIILAVIYFFIKEKIDDKKRQIIEIEFEKQLNIKREELNKVREEYFSRPTPTHIKHALLEFEASYDASSFNGNEFSPLACYGYRVGLSKGRPANIRQEIIEYTWFAKLPDILPYSYRIDWGEPGTYKRYAKILKHIKGLANQRRSRENQKYAVKDWDNDASWLVETHSKLADKLLECRF